MLCVTALSCSLASDNHAKFEVTQNKTSKYFEPSRSFGSLLKLDKNACVKQGAFKGVKDLYIVIYSTPEIEKGGF